MLEALDIPRAAFTAIFAVRALRGLRSALRGATPHRPLDPPIGVVCRPDAVLISVGCPLQTPNSEKPACRRGTTGGFSGWGCLARFPSYETNRISWRRRSLFHRRCARRCRTSCCRGGSTSRSSRRTLRTCCRRRKRCRRRKPGRWCNKPDRTRRKPCTCWLHSAGAGAAVANIAAASAASLALGAAGNALTRGAARARAALVVGAAVLSRTAARGLADSVVEADAGNRWVQVAAGTALLVGTAASGAGAALGYRRCRRSRSRSCPGSKPRRRRRSWRIARRRTCRERRRRSQRPQRSGCRRSSHRRHRRRPHSKLDRFRRTLPVGRQRRPRLPRRQRRRRRHLDQRRPRLTSAARTGAGIGAARARHGGSARAACVGSRRGVRRSAEGLSVPAVPAVVLVVPPVVEEPRLCRRRSHCCRRSPLLP